MRYYSYDEPVFDEDNNVIDNVVKTFSEEEIRKTYYPHWYERMCLKLGKEYVDKNYSFEECLIDWMHISGAWELNQ
jgi:hypothetical protein